MTNYEKLMDSIKDNKKPFIVCDVETTGMMNGNDNRITELALAAYSYNEKNNCYELQDKMFLLRKADIDILKQIIESEKPTHENAVRKITDAYLFSVKNDLKNCQKRIETAEKNLEKCTVKGDAAKITECQNKLDLEQAKYKEIEAMIPVVDEAIQCIKEDKPSIDSRVIKEIAAINAEIKNREQDALAEIETADTLKDILSYQGIDLDTYMKDGKGLTDNEMLIGITNFLQKYQKEDTVFINNGAYATAHYLEKSGIVIGNKDNTIDLTQAERSRHGGKSEWTASIAQFALNYAKDTGNQITTYDAFTKALCIGEMTMSACEMKLINTSEKYLENMVKEQAESMDKDYVMSRARALTLDWIPDIEGRFMDADYHFDSLEYVDFGNDRRYVDLDKMFEVNDNFEVTLEGEKTPIKTWEELEAKIKALNADISKELLDKIHDKYKEVVGKAYEQKDEKKKEALLDDIPEPMKKRIDKIKRAEAGLLTKEGQIREKEKHYQYLSEKLKKMTSDNQKKTEELEEKQRLLRERCDRKILPIMQNIFAACQFIGLEHVRNICISIGENEYRLHINNDPLIKSIMLTPKYRADNFLSYRLKENGPSLEYSMNDALYIIQNLDRLQDAFYERANSYLEESLQKAETSAERNKDMEQTIENLEHELDEYDER